MIRAQNTSIMTITTISVFIAPVGATAQSYDSIYPVSTAQPSCSNQSLGSGMPCLQDDSSVSIYIQNSLSQAGGMNVLWDIAWEYDPTDLTFSYQDPPIYNTSLPSDLETDIIFQMNSAIPPNFGGMTWCDDMSGQPSGGSLPSFRRCDQTYIAFSPAIFPDNTPNTNMVCHEVGHAVGLNHGDASSPAQPNNLFSLRCMRNPVPNDDYVGAYQQTQINNTY